MAKRKTQPEPERPAYPEYDGQELLRTLADYFRYVVVPRVLAERRRKAGDPAASPKDYACRCPVSPADDLPICWGLADHCRFQHRPRPPGPKYWSDRVRHEIFQREYRGFMERWRGEDDMPSEETLRVIGNMLRWRARRRRGNEA